jgi:hypothetical protein
LKKAFFITFLTLFLGLFNLSYSAEDYQTIYDNLEMPDFEYIFGIDPYQTEDYSKYLTSPYPLFRLGVDLRLKNTVIGRGYYLLTPREKNGRDYVLFKQNGKVVYTVPVYKKELVDAMFYQQHVPMPKKTVWQKFCQKASNLVGRMSKDSKRKPLPKAYITMDQIGQSFWEVTLYYDIYEYHLLFKQN